MRNNPEKLLSFHSAARLLRMQTQKASAQKGVDPQQRRGGGWRWWVSLALLEVISLLPAVWGVWCTAIFLFLFPIGSTFYNVALMLLVLLSFIASAVRRNPDDPAKKVLLSTVPILRSFFF
jgi:hypothetical protein